MIHNLQQFMLERNVNVPTFFSIIVCITKGILFENLFRISAFCVSFATPTIWNNISHETAICIAAILMPFFLSTPDPFPTFHNSQFSLK